MLRRLAVEGAEVELEAGLNRRVAAEARDAGIGILHFDQHLERLGDHLGVEARWVSEPS